VAAAAFGDPLERLAQWLTTAGAVVGDLDQGPAKGR
jgi:hypothetical protein